MGQQIQPILQAAAPPSNEQANQLVSGTLTAVGPSLAGVFYGAFNVSLWLSEVDALTTAAASARAKVASGTGIGVGESIISTLVPSGAVVGSALAGLSFSLAGLTNTQIAAILAGTDANAKFVGAGVSGDVTAQIEKSYDGGVTWITVNTDKAGTLAKYQLNSGHINNAVAFQLSEPEAGVAYRVNCVAFASGVLNYRLSATGAAARTYAPPN